MPLFSQEMFQKPITMENAWKYIESASKKQPRELYLLPSVISKLSHSNTVIRPPKRYLIPCGPPSRMNSFVTRDPNENNEDEIIIWLERFRQYALKHSCNLAILEQYEDYRKYVHKRRCNPSRGEFLWLYTRIIERSPDATGFQEAVRIMAGRDALLPFLESIPDKDYYDQYQRIKSPWGATEPTSAAPIPYHGLETAIQEDAPAKVMITKNMCRDVTDAAILNRAIALEKGAVVASMLMDATLDRIVEILKDAHTNWKNPASLFEHHSPQQEDEIASWRDSLGNGFFWYLYRRQSLSLDIIKSLPPKIIATFEEKNRYGISPKDLWSFFRPSPISTETDQCI